MRDPRAFNQPNYQSQNKLQNQLKSMTKHDERVKLRQHPQSIEGHPRATTCTMTKMNLVSSRKYLRACCWFYIINGISWTKFLKRCFFRNWYMDQMCINKTKIFPNFVKYQFALLTTNVFWNWRQQWQTLEYSLIKKSQ